MIYLSIVIPAYNEEKRIGDTLDKIYEFLKTKSYDYEVIVIDDGSRDKTVSVANESRLARIKKLKVLTNGSNRGKGFSVKRGIMNSGGDCILFSDADMSTPIEELDRLLNCMKQGYDIVIGSRSVDESDIRTRQPIYREFMGKIFNFFVKMLLSIEFSDTQCGFKLFSARAAKEIAALMKIEGFSFDVEMLYLAKMKNYKIKEIGVIWNNSPHSKVKVMSSSIDMFFSLFMIRKLHKDTK